MRVHDCDTRLSPQGHLTYRAPGIARNAGMITRWSDGFETFRVHQGRRVPYPHWTLRLFDRDATATGQPVEHFLAEIPADIRNNLEPFAFGQCTMLRWMSRNDAARDLFAANPMLLWLAVAAWRDGHLSERQVGSLLRAKQVQILFHVSGAASAAALRLLRKVQPERGTLSEARKVARLLRTAHARRLLAHEPVVPIALADAVTSHPELRHRSVVRILAAALRDNPTYPRRLVLETADRLRDIGRLARVLEVDNPAQAIARCHSPADLLRLHDRWTERVKRRQDLLDRIGTMIVPGTGDRDDDEPHPRLSRAAISRIEFPAAPLPDDENIRAIRTLSELRAEASLQHHCVADYAESIANCECAIYKVLRPRRATLELKRRARGWKLGDLRHAYNEEAEPAVARYVAEWFAHHCKGPRPPH